MFVTYVQWIRLITMLDIFLLILGFVFCLGGIAGSVLPVLPEPPIAWIGLLLLHLTDAVPINLSST